MGDRVILVGDPTVVSNLAEALLKGEPQFPRPYGSHIAIPLLKGWKFAVRELVLWTNTCSICKVHAVSLKPGGGKTGSGTREPHRQESRNRRRNEPARFLLGSAFDSGLVVIPKRGQKLQKVLPYRQDPCTRSSGFRKTPYSRVVAGLDGEWPT